jgi:site-specific recombinase XerD
MHLLYRQTQEEHMELNKAIEGYLIARTADGYSPETLIMYRWALELICSQIGTLDVEKIKAGDLERFWTWVRTDYRPTRMSGDTSPLAGRSLENVWTASRSFFNWAEETFNLKQRPDLKIRRPRYKPNEITPLSHEDVDHLLAACQRTAPAKTERREAFSMPRATSLRDVAMVLLLLDSGLRVSECARLKVKDVNLTSGEVIVAAW